MVGLRADSPCGFGDKVWAKKKQVADAKRAEACANEPVRRLFIWQRNSPKVIARNISYLVTVTKSDSCLARACLVFQHSPRC